MPCATPAPAHTELSSSSYSPVDMRRARPPSRPTGLLCIDTEAVGEVMLDMSSRTPASMTGSES